MSQDTVVSICVSAMELALKIGLPILLVGLVIGLVVSVFQAVTQIQEQTLTFIPKIAAMFAAAIMLMPLISQRLLEYAQVMFWTQELYGQIPSLVG